MAKVKLGFTALSVPVQIERARNIYSKMDLNPAFPSPSPGLAQFAAAINKLEKAWNESRSRDTVRMAHMRLRRKEMLQLVRQLGAYVQVASGGDLTKILSSGFDIAGTGTSRPPVGQVYNLRLKEGTWTGEIRALWNKVPGAICYEVHLADTLNPDSFRHYRTVCKTRFVLTDLVPGRIYHVRVIAIGRKGYGAFSDIGTKVAAL